MIYTFFAHPVENIPPVINSGILLSQNGYDNIIIGYKNNYNSSIQSLSVGCKIFRIKLKSRNIKIGSIRKIFSIIEYVFICRKIYLKKKPLFTIHFNEIASIVGRLIPKSHQIHWALEFPENESKTKAEKIIKVVAYKSWNYASLIIFPTNIRKAMGMVLNPKIISKSTLIIHNAPLLQNIHTATTNNVSSDALLALKFIETSKKDSKSIIVYAGAVGNRYGWDSLIQSIGSIPERYALLILGPKHELGYSEFNISINKCLYPSNILWLNSIPYFEMQKILENADIGFVHYRGDTLNTYFSAPGKLYEYLKAGLAILTDTNTCIADEIRLANCGLTFEAPICIDKLNNLLLNASLDDISTMKLNSIKLFKSTFNFEIQMKSLLIYLNENDK